MKHTYTPVHGDDQQDPAWKDEGITPPSKERWGVPARVVVEAVLLVLIVVALSVQLAIRIPGCPPGPNEPLKDFGFVDTVFMNDTRYANEEAFLSMDNLLETLKQWVSLSSKGRGFVGIPKDERQRLDGPPYEINPLHRPGMHEAYMLSGFHQLHCLSTIMHSYGKLRMGEDESEMGYHIAHCFDYLRQGILCAGDLTLEGNNTARYPGVEVPWGTTHRCVNWEAAREWADERTVVPFPDAIGIL